MKMKLVLIFQCWLLWNIGAIKFVSVACFLTWLLDLVKFEWFICSSYSFQLAKINTSETRIDTKISLRIRKALLQSWNLTQFYFLHFIFYKMNNVTLRKKWSFPLWIYLINVTKSVGYCGFGPFTGEILNEKLKFMGSANIKQDKIISCRMKV